MAKKPATNPKTKSSQMHANHRRRAREYGQELGYTLAELREKIDGVMGYGCCWCTEILTVDNYGGDHQVPVSRGGAHSLDNLRIICKRCNEIKGSLSDREFNDLLRLIESWPSMAREDVLRRLRAGGRIRR